MQLRNLLDNVAWLNFYDDKEMSAVTDSLAPLINVEAKNRNTEEIQTRRMAAFLFLAIHIAQQRFQAQVLSNFRPSDPAAAIYDLPSRSLLLRGSLQPRIPAQGCVDHAAITQVHLQVAATIKLE